MIKLKNLITAKRWLHKKHIYNYNWKSFTSNSSNKPLVIDLKDVQSDVVMSIQNTWPQTDSDEVKTNEPKTQFLLKQYQ